MSGEAPVRMDRLDHLVNIRDPDGNLIEISNYPALSP